MSRRVHKLAALGALASWCWGLFSLTWRLTSGRSSGAMIAFSFALIVVNPVSLWLNCRALHRMGDTP